MCSGKFNDSDSDELESPNDGVRISRNRKSPRVMLPDEQISEKSYLSGISCWTDWCSRISIFESNIEYIFQSVNITLKTTLNDFPSLLNYRFTLNFSWFTKFEWGYTVSGSTICVLWLQMSRCATARVRVHSLFTRQYRILDGRQKKKSSPFENNRKHRTFRINNPYVSANLIRAVCRGNWLCGIPTVTAQTNKYLPTETTVNAATAMKMMPSVVNVVVDWMTFRSSISWRSVTWGDKLRKNRSECELVIYGLTDGK